jgi:DNA-binding transcriptional ArsR family regulator
MAVTDLQVEEEPIQCGCKVGRLVEDYGLHYLHDELQRRWTDDADRYSVRELEALLNQGLIRAELEAVGDSPLDGEVENLYELLTSDDVSSGKRIEARRRLERRDVDVDRLSDDFVSHQTVYRHLTSCLDLEYESDCENEENEVIVERSLETLRALKRRTTVVSEGTTNRLNDRDIIDIEDPQVFVDLSVTCIECGNDFSLTELGEGATCDC